MNSRKGVEINYAPNDFQENIKNIINKKIDSFEYFSIDYIEEDYHIPIYFVIYESLKELKTGSYGLFTHNILTKFKYYLYKYSKERILIIDFGINGINKIYDINNNFLEKLKDKLNNIDFNSIDLLEKLRKTIVIDPRCIINNSSEISY